MDWSKAKNILIAALLITNLVLALAIYRNVSGMGSEQEELKHNTSQLLQAHEIYVEEDLIPGRTERLPVMSVRYRTASRDTIAEITAASMELRESSGEEDYRRVAEELLEHLGVKSESYVFEEMTADGDVTEVIFGMEYEGYSLNNAKIRVRFRDGKAVDVSDSWAEPVAMGQNRKRVLPAHEALVRFMTMLEAEKPVRDEIRVDQMYLVYWLEGFTEHSGVSEDTAVPYWRIDYNDGECDYIAAYEE